MTEMDEAAPRYLEIGLSRVNAAKLEATYTKLLYTVNACDVQPPVGLASEIIDSFPRPLIGAALIGISHFQDVPFEELLYEVTRKD